MDRLKMNARIMGRSYRDRGMVTEFVNTIIAHNGAMVHNYVKMCFKCYLK